MNAKKDNFIGLVLGGGIIGAVLGIIAAYILIKSAEQANITPHLNAKKGLRLGFGIVSLLRSLSKISRGE